MKWLASVAALLVLFSAGACVHRRDPRLPPEPPPDQADAGAPAPDDVTTVPDRAVTGVRFEVDPPDAEIIIDERSYGAASALGRIPLEPGIYRVAVKAPGYGTWRAEITVGTKVEVLQVALPKR